MHHSLVMNASGGGLSTARLGFHSNSLGLNCNARLVQFPPHLLLLIGDLCKFLIWQLYVQYCIFVIPLSPPFLYITLLEYRIVHLWCFALDIKKKNSKLKLKRENDKLQLVRVWGVKVIPQKNVCHHMHGAEPAVWSIYCAVFTEVFPPTFIKFFFFFFKYTVSFISSLCCSKCLGRFIQKRSPHYFFFFFLLPFWMLWTWPGAHPFLLGVPMCLFKSTQTCVC